MVHVRAACALLLFAAGARADVAVPKTGPILRGALRVEARTLVIGEETVPLSDFLLVEKDDGTLVWSPDFASRVAGYRRIVYEGRRAQLVELAKEAVRARATKTARRLYDQAKREGLEGKEEKIVRKRVENLEKKWRKVNEKRLAEVKKREAALRGQLTGLLLARAKLEGGDDGLRLLRLVLDEQADHAGALALLDERVPADSEFDQSRAWLDWHLDFESRGFRRAPAELQALRRAQHYWRPDLYAIESRELRMMTPITEMQVVRRLALRFDIALRWLREFFKTDKPLARSPEPLTVYLYASPENFRERIRYKWNQVLPPDFLFENARWNLKEDLSRVCWPPLQKDRKYVEYTSVHEVVRHWLWSRNPRYSVAQLMAHLNVQHLVPGFWIEAGLAGLVAEAEYDLDAGTVDLSKPGSSCDVVRKQATARGGLIEWPKFFLMNSSDVRRLNVDKEKIGAHKSSYVFGRQAVAVCHYLYNADGGKHRTQLRDFLVNHYLGNRKKLAPVAAFGVSSEELGHAVVVDLRRRQ